MVLGLVSALAAAGFAYWKVLSVDHNVRGLGSTLQSLQPKTMSTSKCAELVLSDYDTKGCEALAAGDSCEVACPADKQGHAVRFWCFSKLAEAKAPPAGVSLPTCTAKDAKPFEVEFSAPIAIDEGVGTFSCLDCGPWSKCVVKELEDPREISSCSILHFKLAPGGPNVFQARSAHYGDLCLDIFPDATPGLWKCNVNGENQLFEIQEASRWTRAQLCSLSSRGRVCFGKIGLPPLMPAAPAPRHLTSLLEAAQKSDRDSIVKAGLVVQQCRAMLESSVPNSFWSWLDRQGGSFKRSLFASFPVHPNQINLLHAITEAGDGFFSMFCLRAKRSGFLFGCASNLVRRPVRQASKQASRQAGRQASKRASTQPGRQAGKQASELLPLLRLAG